MFHVQNKLFSIPEKSQDIFEKSAKEVVHRECSIWWPDQDVALLFWMEAQGIFTLNQCFWVLWLKRTRSLFLVKEVYKTLPKSIKAAHTCDPSTGRQQREDGGFKSYISYVVSFKSAWVTGDPRSNKQYFAYIRDLVCHLKENCGMVMLEYSGKVACLGRKGRKKEQ